MEHLPLRRGQGVRIMATREIQDTAQDTIDKCCRVHPCVDGVFDPRLCEYLAGVSRRNEANLQQYHDRGDNLFWPDRDWGCVYVPQQPKEVQTGDDQLRGRPQECHACTWYPIAIPL